MKADVQSGWIHKAALGVFTALLTADAFSGRPEPFAQGGTVSVGEDAVVYSRTSESGEGGRFSLTWEFPEWEKDTYVFVPACIYNGNRDFTCQDRKDLSGFCYPPKFELSDLVRTDVRLVTDIPKLNEDGSGLIEVTTGDMATPCVGLYFPTARRGVLIFTAQQVRGRNIGYSIESGRVRVDCPANRKSVYAFCAPHLENVDRPLALKAGDRVELPYAVMDFSADGVTGFFETFFRNRNRLLPRSRIRAPYSKELIVAVENGINRDSWQESGYWAEGRTGRWTVGWVGGMPTAWGMLAGGLEPVSHERAMRVPDFLAANQTPFGAYIERWVDGRRGHQAGDNRVNGETDCDYQLVRRSAEGLFYLLRLVDRIKLKAQWLSSARLAADGFVRAWREYGDWGMYADVSSGRPLVGGTANAALACAALVRAYRVFGEPAYLDVACEAGTSYYDRFVAKGLV